LLYGPPRTGKSYLAKAVTTNANSMFYSISSSKVISKYMGDSKRLVKSFLTMGKEISPSIVFIDEIDSLCSTRGESKNEATRHVKTKLLVPMNGVGKDASGVLILAATNISWYLDTTVCRRF
jgi:vacuolar protein-sorting-associated protein 4